MVPRPRIRTATRTPPPTPTRVRTTASARRAAAASSSCVAAGTRTRAGRARPPTLVFPALGAVGGASLNQLMRRKILHEGGTVPVHFEADHPALWERARAADRRVPRWIDGHACYGAAERLGAPFMR